MSESSPASAGTAGRGAAVGLALVLLAVTAGAIWDNLDDPGPVAPVAVVASGHTTTVEVTMRDMRFHPDHLTVPYGDRLVIRLTNADTRRHDLVLSNGARSGSVPKSASTTMDAGVVGAPLSGWCSLPGHRQAGMVLTVAVSGAPAGPAPQPSAAAADPTDPAAATVDPMAAPPAGFTARDATLAPAPAQRIHQVTLHVVELEQEVAPGVRQRMWTFGGQAPGPVLRGRIGDVFDITLINDGTVEHGIDFHAGALAPDQPMRPVEPGQRIRYRFTATRAGIWMYHCSAAPMLHHVGNGMYGAVVIDPPDLAPVAREYLLVQSELYLGPTGQPGDLTKMLADAPDAVVFNGYLAQYAHRPLVAIAGERVRVWVLDAGPSRDSAFHIVGTVFDTVFTEGAYRLRPTDPGGAQVLALAPASGGFVELVFAQPGRYPFLSHVMVDAERGARGAVQVG
ncbi:MAG TPA: multicopper oxidase domain-containing protein [Micromonosporaceae bacterium]